MRDTLSQAELIRIALAELDKLTPDTLSDADCIIRIEGVLNQVCASLSDKQSADIDTQRKSLIGETYSPDDERFARLLDSMYRAGAKAGWNACFNQYVEATRTIGGSDAK